MTEVLQDTDAVVDAIIAAVGKHVVIGLPIALASPVHVINALYERAKADPSISLRIVTGLSVTRPQSKNELEDRFMAPIVDRLFQDCPDATYAVDFANDAVPPNVEVVEFYMKAGAFLKNVAAQHHYISTNYTHVGRDMVIQGVNVFVQAIAKRGDGDSARYSLSSNSDCLSLFPLLRAAKAPDRPMLIVGQVNRRMPFMPRDAEIPAGTFDLLLDDPGLDYAPFASPAPPISDAEHMIGLRISGLIRDGGTLQIGIGALGDAIASACSLRHNDNSAWREAVKAAGVADRDGDAIASMGGDGIFERGLYGSTEMFADCFRALYQDGVLKRIVYGDAALQRLANEHDLKPDETARAFDLLCDNGSLATPLGEKDVAFLKRIGVLAATVEMEGDAVIAPDGARLSRDIGDPAARAAIKEHCLGPRLLDATVLHGGFFLGPRRMYEMLEALPEEELDLFCMTGIGYVNQLYGNEPIATLQRRDARFINTAMMMTLMGAACSDGLESGQVVSGVGGQYNFVSMAHALDGARSILTLRSVREKDGKATSNIVWNYGHITIPRHLRDVVVTEYGVADLRGRQDHEVIKLLIGVADARFQDELRAKAVAAGKLSSDWPIPEHYRANKPDRIKAALKPFKSRGLFGAFPLGCDFTDEELAIGKALKGLQSKMRGIGGASSLVAGAIMTEIPAKAQPYLDRLGLASPTNVKEKMMRRLVAEALSEAGVI